MKANKTTILLLGSLFIVWGVIGFMLYRYFKGPDLTTVVTHKPTTQHKTTIDTFSLLLNYSNPFNTGFTTKSRKTNSTMVSISEKSSSNSRATIKNGKPEIKLQYLGLMGAMGKSKIILVSLNGEEINLQTGEQIEGYTVKKATPDELTLIKGKERTIFIRQ